MPAVGYGVGSGITIISISGAISGFRQHNTNFPSLRLKSHHELSAMGFGNGSPLHLSVTMYVRALAIAPGAMIAANMSIETNWSVEARRSA